ncbi:YbhB/YbcL family Raf kinase inhibitor-like protein [Phytobacter sp. V91]|uniref:YbhB/YbcL family Raf kinase inhibitor-like protein n=1 Tax=Phytobacter sp. V91 TaxID=3369425 RepID=UPI003F6038C1
MKLFSHDFNDHAFLPDEFCFARQDAATHLSLADNKNPHLGWQNLPEGTQSLVLICHDPDVPTRADDVNQEGKTVPASLPRTDFYHWLLLDIPASQTEILTGSHASEVTAGGKSGPQAAGGLRHGINSYTAWFSGDAAMAGTWYGYDGPCPPWNDEIVHHYIFTLYALGTPALDVSGELNGENIKQALAQSQVLGSASLTALYSLNPALTA